MCIWSTFAANSNRRWPLTSFSSNRDLTLSSLKLDSREDLC